MSLHSLRQSFTCTTDALTTQIVEFSSARPSLGHSSGVPGVVCPLHCNVMNIPATQPPQTPPAYRSLLCVNCLCTSHFSRQPPLSSCHSQRTVSSTNNEQASIHCHRHSHTGIYLGKRPYIVLFFKIILQVNLMWRHDA